MDQRSRNAFLLLLALQVAHSIEEYATGLYEWGLPALISGMVYPPEPAVGFALANGAVLAFGAWCYLARVQPDHEAAVGWASVWVIIELINGLLHPLLALTRLGYFPGVFTAPVLLVVAIYLANRLSRAPSAPGVPLRGARP